MSEHLWGLATPRGVNLDAVSRGGDPEWTQEDVALAAAGLPRIEFAIALYSLAGDDSMWSVIRTYLLEYLLAERERWGWATKVETINGCRVRFSEDLVRWFLADERRPAVFQAAPHLRAIALGVEPEVWRRTISHQWACIAGEYARRLVNAEEHVRRRIKKGVDGN